MSKEENVTSGKVVQGRNFCYIVYPESMKPDLFQLLLIDSDKSQKMSNHFSVLISPLHDSDVDELGNIKKPHYHIMIMHSGDVTLAGAKRYGEMLGMLLAEKCGKKAMARYLCHLDNAEKHLYSVDDVIAYNCNYLEIVGSTADKFGYMRELIEFVNEQDILFYCDLVDYCKDNDDDKFKFLMTGGTYNIEKYIRERRAKYAFHSNLTM